MSATRFRPIQYLFNALLLAACVLLAGCEQLGIESPAKQAAAKEADGKAIGSACRHAGRAIEDCYTMNPRANKAAMFTGWKEMNDYMRENNIAEVKPELAAEKSDKLAKKSEKADKDSAKPDEAAAAEGEASSEDKKGKKSKDSSASKEKSDKKKDSADKAEAADSGENTGDTRGAKHALHKGKLRGDGDKAIAM